MLANRSATVPYAVSTDSNVGVVADHPTDEDSGWGSGFFSQIGDVGQGIANGIRGVLTTARDIEEELGVPIFTDTLRRRQQQTFTPSSNTGDSGWYDDGQRVETAAQAASQHGGLTLQGGLGVGLLIAGAALALFAVVKR